jgi:YgiT-type zinc finger domain-containing protein
MEPRLPNEKEARMNCPLCKTGEMKPGTTTLTLERGDTTLILKEVPAEVCDQCEHKLPDSNATDRARELLNDAVRRGVQVEVAVFSDEAEHVSS